MSTTSSFFGIEEILIDEALEYIVSEQYGVNYDLVNLEEALLYKFMVISVVEHGCDIHNNIDAEMSRTLERMLYDRKRLD